MSDRDNSALAEAIKRIERLEGNDVYLKAWRKAARVLKDMLVNRSAPDSGEKIGLNATVRSIAERAD